MYPPTCQPKNKERFMPFLSLTVNFPLLFCHLKLAQLWISYTWQFDTPSWCLKWEETPFDTPNYVAGLLGKHWTVSPFCLLFSADSDLSCPFGIIEKADNPSWQMTVQSAFWQSDWLTARWEEVELSHWEIKTVASVSLYKQGFFLKPFWFFQDFQLCSIFFKHS